MVDLLRLPFEFASPEPARGSFLNEKSFLPALRMPAGARVAVGCLPDLRAAAAARTACCSGMTASTSAALLWEP